VELVVDSAETWFIVVLISLLLSLFMCVKMIGLGIRKDVVDDIPCKYNVVLVDGAIPMKEYD